jgi:hypothetical protein
MTRSGAGWQKKVPRRGSAAGHVTAGISQAGFSMAQKDYPFQVMVLDHLLRSCTMIDFPAATGKQERNQESSPKNT